jgi:hypothetical protein
MSKLMIIVTIALTDRAPLTIRQLPIEALLIVETSLVAANLSVVVVRDMSSYG